MRAQAPATLRLLADYTWRLVVIAIGLVLAAMVLARLRIVVLPLILALLLTTLLAPAMSWLRSHGSPRLAGAWATMLGALVLLAGVIVGLTTGAMEEWEGLDVRLSEGVDRVERWLVEGPLGLDPNPLGRIRDGWTEWIAGHADGLTGSVIGGATLILEIVAGILLAFVLLFFFLKDGDRIWAWCVRQWPREWRRHVDEGGRRAFTTLSSYLRGTAIVATVDAVLIGTALWLIGVPFVLPLSLLTFFGGFLPLVGATVAGAIAALVALVTEGFTDALIVVGVIVVVQQVEGDVLAPVVLGRSLNLHPLAILLAVTAGAALAGIVGAFLAVPTAAVGWTLLEYAREARSEPDDLPAKAATGPALTPPSMTTPSRTS